jgi:hypothetical protein
MRHDTTNTVTLPQWTIAKRGDRYAVLRSDKKPVRQPQLRLTLAQHIALLLMLFAIAVASAGLGYAVGLRDGGNYVLRGVTR